jgi:outer membrane protein
MLPRCLMPLTRIAALIFAAAPMAWAPHVQAESLLELYQHAKAFDASYLASKAQAEAVTYQAEQSYALRRPMVNLKGSLGRQYLNADSVDTTDPSAALMNLGKNSGATNKSLAVQAKQSLYNGVNNATVAQAEQSVVAAQADLDAAEDDLMVRLTQAYFDVLSAQDLLLTTQVNKKAFAEQLAAAKRSFEVGNATITDTREAQARFDLVAAQEIAFQNELQVKRMALDQLVGRENVAALSLKTPVDLSALEPVNIDNWVGLTANSPSIRKAQVGITVAQLALDKARAEHLPTADLMASLTQQKVTSNSISAMANNGLTSSIGIEVNVPLFAGFATQNKVKEALSLKDKSELDLENAKRSLSLSTRQAFFGVRSGMAQVRALEAAESSAKLALEATQLGYRVGVRVNKDVLDAQTALTSTQKDLYKARYDVLVTNMRLRQVAGSLDEKDLQVLDGLLTSPQVMGSDALQSESHLSVELLNKQAAFQANSQANPNHAAKNRAAK